MRVPHRVFWVGATQLRGRALWESKYAHWGSRRFLDAVAQRFLSHRENNELGGQIDLMLEDQLQREHR